MVESIAVLIGNFILPYLVLSLLTLLIVELIAALTQQRGKLLRSFVQNMLNDPKGTGMAADFYRHHLINSLSLKGYLPAYIPSRLFALVLAELIESTTKEKNIISGAEHLPDTKLRKGIMTAIAQAPSSMELRAIEIWFNEVMDGASGAYRLKTLLMVAVVSATMVIFTNFDAIRISNYISQRNVMEKIYEAQLMATIKNNQDNPKKATPENSEIDNLKIPQLSLPNLAFPVGWVGEVNSARAVRESRPFLNSWLPIKIVGLLASIFAIMIGAPFLFDVLNRFMVVRSTVKPWEKEL
jgi:hypothetical protein